MLVPSAPVPFGGALIYVPVEWVKPADGGVERLMNVYVSMGVTPPVSMPGVTPAPLAATPANPPVASVAVPAKQKTRRRKKPDAIPRD